MKRCPECARDYDNTMSFCLDDGAELLYGPALVNEPATAILSEPHALAGGPSESATRAQIHTTEQTAILPAATGDIVPKSTGFDKRLLAAPLLLVIIVLGGFVAYKYFAPAKQVESIAVMPFVNDNADLEFLSDGITETLINSLSQVPNLNVKARSSVFRYKGKDAAVQTVGKELNVQAILNGHVVQHADQLSINLELIDVQTENVIWSDKYDRKQTDLVSLQSEIARDVSQKLKTKLSGADEQKVAKTFTTNPEAYQLYLKGRYVWNKREAKETDKAIQFYQQAIELDPNYALAFAGLAECYITEQKSQVDEFPKVTAAAQKAIELDPALGEPHAALANIRDTYQLDYAGAEQEFKRAIELSPSYATAHHWYGEFLAKQGRFDESFAEYRKALELEPYSLAIATDLGEAYRCARQYDRAIEHLKKLEEMDPNYERTPFYLARTYEDAGRFEDATAEYVKAFSKIGVSTKDLEADRKQLLDAAKRSGPLGYWKKLAELNRGRSDNNVQMAIIYAHSGQRDQAMELLEKMYESHEIGRLGLKVDPDWDELRGDPRFIELMRKIGFPE